MAFGLFHRDEHGSVTVLSAILLPVMIGVGALVLEYGGGLLAKVRLQRVADIAAFAGATAYAKNSSPSAIAPAAQQIGRLNGVDGSAVTAALVASPRGDGTQVVQATVSIARPIYLARVLGVKSDLSVGATAYASIGGGVSSCVLALNSAGTGVTLSGGTSLTAAQCSVASNNSIAVPCGTTVMAKEAAYDGAAPSAPCGGLKNATGGTLSPKKANTTDPLASDAGVSTARARHMTVDSLASPSAPTVAVGKPIDFAWSQSDTQTKAIAIGCTASWVQPTWTLTCPSGGTYNFSTMTVGGGIALKFNLNGTSATTYNFSEKLQIAGSTIQFGPGVFRFGKGLKTEGGTTVSFGAGSFAFGRYPDTCTDGLYSICHTGTSLTFDGPSNFEMNSGFNVPGGSTLNLGAGTSNTYDIGAAGTSGTAIATGNGARVTLADASSGSGFFRTAGHIVSSGGSCMTLPVAAQHDVKGNLNAQGGTLLGAGVYTVNGYIAFGATSGGSVTCNGESIGVKGIGVTLVTNGAGSYAGSGDCSGKAFCMGAGYNSTTLSAPTGGTTAKLLVVGPATGTAGARFTGGAAATMSGAFYFPRGQFYMSGGATVASGACLQIIASEITLTGGTTAASTCVSGGASSGTVAVIQ